MSYFDYRGHIRGKVLGVCPDLIEHKDGFNRENIPSTIESGFHILPGNISSEFESSQCDNYLDEQNVSLLLIFCGGRYVSDEIDAALTKAHCIRNELIKRAQFPIDDTLRFLNVTDIRPDPATTNDNTILVELSLVLFLQLCTDAC